MATGFASRGAYARTRPIAVVEALSELSGPISGIVTLPKRLDWSPDSRYDLSDPDQAVWMYSYVLAGAVVPTDLRTFLNDELLRALWPRLVLTDQVRLAWERHHPALAA